MSIVFDLGLEFAEQRRTRRGLDCAKYCFDRGWGARIHGWRFLALVLSAQERHAEADAVLEYALEETSLREQGPLLRTRAKVQLVSGDPLLAVQSYRLLLALFQVEREKRAEPGDMFRAKVIH